MSISAIEIYINSDNDAKYYFINAKRANPLSLELPSCNYKSLKNNRSCEVIISWIMSTD